METANDRFKRSFSTWFWSSMIAAVAIHFAMLSFWPDLRASDVSFTMDDFEAVELPPEIDVPPPPEPIQRPAMPVVSEAVIDPDITIASTAIENNPPDDLPAPRTRAEEGIGERPVFTPMEVRPELVNTAEIQRVLEREYPSTLQDAGIGGVVVLHLFVDETGAVQNSVISSPSGYVSMDEAAARVAEVMKFSPAINQNQPVPVWIEQTIRFIAR